MNLAQVLERGLIDASRHDSERLLGVGDRASAGAIRAGPGRARAGRLDDVDGVVDVHPAFRFAAERSGCSGLRLAASPVQSGSVGRRGRPGRRARAVVGRCGRFGRYGRYPRPLRFGGGALRVGGGASVQPGLISSPGSESLTGQ